MATVVGSKKQEAKISELGSIANKMFPDIGTMLFKGAFRLGIKAALKKEGMKNWEEVATRVPEVRRKFFHSALEESVPHLKVIGLSENDINKLISLLKMKNEKYLIT
jgi:hypothetical protein